MPMIALIYGALAGGISIGVIMLNMAFNGAVGPGSEWLGYLIMILALTLIFFGVKRYRDRELGGIIRFGPAFVSGLAIAVVASAIYVLVWEIYNAATGFIFFENYAEAVLQQKQAQGLTGAELEAERIAMDGLRTQYANPLFRLPITFSEIFPVGLLVAFISAFILKNPRALPAHEPTLTKE